MSLGEGHITLAQARLLKFLDCVTEARFVEIKRGLNMPDKTIWEVLERTVNKGFVVKVDSRYRITDAGRALLSTWAVKQMLQQAYVQQTSLVQIPFARVIWRHLKHKIEKAADQANLVKVESPLDLLRIGVSYALLKRAPITSDEKKLVDHVLDACLNSFIVSCFPPVEQDKQEFIGDIAFDAIKQMLEDKNYLEKVLKNRKYTLVISLDLSKLEENTAQNLLQWIFGK